MAKKQLFVLDAETDPFKLNRVPKPFLWGLYNGEDYWEFEETSELIEFVEDLDILVYAHNGGKFDYHFLLKYLEHANDVTIINGRLAKFYIGLCEFRDSFNILPIPLAAYQKDKIDYAIFEPEERIKPENWKEIRKYLYKDCVYLYDMVSKFEGEYGRNLTQAGAAMKIWAKMSKKAPPKSTEEFYDSIAPYYYGGRVQCFKQGTFDKPFKMADINSAYPYAMLHKHPSTTANVYKNEPLPMNLFYNNPGAFFVTVEGISLGAFPFRVKGPQGGTFYPADWEKRIYHVTGWELLAAIETDTIKHWQTLGYHIFTFCDHFKDYINYFYEKRLQAKRDKDKAQDLFAKLLMNSLYGKFAANPNNYSKFYISNEMPPADYFGGLLGPWYLVKEPLEDEEKNFYNIATAASITGFVRAMLWRALCGSENPIYCDTDCIAATGFGDIGFGDALGEWKIEGEFKRGYLGGKKLYAFQYAKGGYKTASKGVRLNASQIKRIAQGDTIEHEPDVPTFSVHKQPHFIKRRIRSTARDITRLPSE